MELPGYDRWKTTPPDMEGKALEQCAQCGSDICEGQEALYDQEGGVHYCDDDCLKEYIKENPSEFLELIKEHFVETVEMKEEGMDYDDYILCFED